MEQKEDSHCEQPDLLFIFWGNSQLFICPLGRVRVRKMTKDFTRFMPEMPQDPEPHESTEELRLETLRLGQIHHLPVARLNVDLTASMADSVLSPRYSAEQPATGPNQRRHDTGSKSPFRPCLARLPRTAHWPIGVPRLIFVAMVPMYTVHVGPSAEKTPTGRRSGAMCTHQHLSCCSWTPGPDHHPRGLTFVLGALDGDPVKLSILKDYVCKALSNLVHSFSATSFNIIYFSHVISKWCDSPVIWSPESVAQAVSWIRGLACGSGAGPTDALVAAYEDPMCQAVYLVMDSLPPSVLRDIYSFLASNESTGAVNVVYLLEESSDSQAEGSFREINLKPLGSSSMIKSNGNVSKGHLCLTPSPCKVSPVHHHELWPPSFSCNRTCKGSPGTCPLNLGQVTTAPAALSLLRGARVLARRDLDGLYYMGHIAREIESSSDRFLVEFEKCRALKGRGQFRMQETPVCDIIHYEDTRWRPLVPGDHVLAPVDHSMEQYGPGTILRGTESRERGLAFDSTGVLVTFWNGKTKQIAAGLSVWIPQNLNDRITLELHIPLDARKKLMESCPSFPFIGTTYKHPECQDGEGARPGSHDCLYCRPTTSDVCQRCHVPAELWAALRNSLNHVSKIASAKEKPSSKVDKEKDLKRNASVNTVYSKGKVNAQRRTVEEKRGHQLPEQKEHVTCTRDTQTDQSDISPTIVNLKTNEDTAASPYEPSSSRLGSMMHLQATLQRIERAMKDDQKVLESALLERRPRSAPLKLNYEAKARSSQEAREQKEAEKARLWRMQREERQRRREEKFRGREQQELALQDSRRLRSEQRILLDQERRQNQAGLEALKADSRRLVAEERHWKKDEDLEQEWRKEEDRLKFFRNLRQQREKVDLEKSQRLNQEEDMQKDPAQSKRMAQQEADLQEWHRHQELQSGAKRRVSKRLEQFYQQAEQEAQKDRDLQRYLKDHNLRMLRSAMVL